MFADGSGTESGDGKKKNKKGSGVNRNRGKKVNKKCKAGNFLTDDGCQQCPENTFSADKATSCTSCPDGKISPAGSTSASDCEYGENF